MDNKPEKWLTMEEIQEYVNASRHTVLNWIADKGMPAHKIGIQWRFKASEIDEWIKSGDAKK